MKPVTYVSVDVEADGPIPNGYSMLSLGAAAFELGNRTPLATFEVNLLPHPQNHQDPATMAWWATQPEAWQYLQQNRVSPLVAMPAFKEWLLALPGVTVFVGYPVTFDFMWVYDHMIRYAGGFPAPFGFSGLDIKTLAMAKMGKHYPYAKKRDMPKHWFEGCPPHTHKALDDALGQGVMFINMMTDNEPTKASHKHT